MCCLHQDVPTGHLGRSLAPAQLQSAGGIWDQPLLRGYRQRARGDGSQALVAVGSWEQQLVHFIGIDTGWESKQQHEQELIHFRGNQKATTITATSATTKQQQHQ